MFQRMRGAVSINVPDIDLTRVTDIEVELVQENTGVEMLFAGDDVVVTGETALTVVIPKDMAMSLEVEPLRGQIMFTYIDSGFPDATKPFIVPISELIKEAGYGD